MVKFGGGAVGGGTVSTQKVQFGPLIRIAPSNPAAGADISITVTASQQWRLIQFYAKLVTSATAADRGPFLQIKSGSNVLWETNLSSVVIPASKTAGVQADVNASGTTSTGNLGTWDYYMKTLLPVSAEVAGGDLVVTSTTSIQTGDQWSGVRLAYVRVI